MLVVPGVEDDEPQTRPRRDALVDAALRVLQREGPRGVSHRAVAAEAELPLAATTYYFTSKEELLAEALQRVAGAETARLRALTEQLAHGDVRTAGGALGARALIAEHGSMLLKFEIYLEAARRPELRASCAAWIDGFRDVAEAILRGAGARDPTQGARILVATIDGLMVQQLATSAGPPDEITLRVDLEHLVDALLNA
jgi:DNA-binding transcriptional regulator YbjK